MCFWFMLFTCLHETIPRSYSLVVKQCSCVKASENKYAEIWHLFNNTLNHGKSSNRFPPSSYVSLFKAFKCTG